jgi:hypothetical protein
MSNIRISGWDKYRIDRSHHARAAIRAIGATMTR